MTSSKPEDLARTASEKVSDVADNVSDVIRDARDGDLVHDVRERVMSFYNENPMRAKIIGLVAVAAIASLISRSARR